MLRGREAGGRGRDLKREGGDRSPLSSLPKTISHIIQASMEGRTPVGGDDTRRPDAALAISDNCPSRPTG